MSETTTDTNFWQYVLVWTPGPRTSVVQLWAANRQGWRTLWDSWEVEGLVGIPTIGDVLSALHSASVELHERHSHLT